MSFGSIQPDLSNTIFTPENYEFAHKYLHSAIKRHDPAWLNKPVGPLRTHWLANGPHSACYLIELARILSTLQANVTEKSTPSLIAKFRSLLHANSNRQFEELLTEFQVAHILSERVSPIALEPLVPNELLGKSNQPASPDFAIRLPEADVFIEVTVLRFGALDQWDMSVELISEELRRQVLKNRLRRSFVLKFPLVARHNDLPVNISHHLISEVLSNEYGEWRTEIHGKGATVKWAPFPHFMSLHEHHSDAEQHMLEELTLTLGLQRGELAATAGPERSPSVQTLRSLIPDESLDELLLKSLRNSLNQKRRQFPHEALYVLVVKLGHHRLIASAMEQLLIERIWPNPDYSWIMGLCFFTPRAEFEQSSPPAALLLNPNPNARIQPPQSFLDLFAGRRQFHLHR